MCRIDPSSNIIVCTQNVVLNKYLRVTLIRKPNTVPNVDECSQPQPFEIHNLIVPCWKLIPKTISLMPQKFESSESRFSHRH